MLLASLTTEIGCSGAIQVPGGRADVADFPVEQPVG